MTRVRASLIHLAISLCVALSLTAYLFFVLYPAPLFRAVGGATLFLMLLGIDVILGPLLTLIVFNPKKKSLKLDMAVIALVQLAALAYGLSVLWAGRPVYIAALGHRFDLVQAMDIQTNKVKPDEISLPKWGPALVGTKKDTNPAEHEKIHISAIGGIDYGHYPEYHTPFSQIQAETLSKSDTISKLYSVNKGREAEIDVWLNRHGSKPEESRAQLLRTRGKDLTVLLDKNGKFLGIEDFIPPP